MLATFCKSMHNSLNAAKIQDLQKCNGETTLNTWDMQYVKLALCNNYFGGTKLKRNYILGYMKKKGWIPLLQTTLNFCSNMLQGTLRQKYLALHKYLNYATIYFIALVQD
jgi:hypothetical protein